MYEYSPMGDMSVFLLCILLLMLLIATYTEKTKRYKYVIVAIINLIYISIISIIYNYYLYPNTGNINENIIYIFHNSLHISLIAQLLLYVFYILDLISYQNKCLDRIIHGLFVVYLIVEMTTPWTHVGFYIENGIAYSYAHDIIYLIWYILYIAIIVTVVLLKNKTIISRIYVSVVLTMAISVYITISEYNYNTESFTVLSYYIPIVSVVMLFHSNSYNSNFGTVDRAALVAKLTDLNKSGKDYTFVNMDIPGFSKLESHVQTSQDFKKFTYAIHYTDYLFRYSDENFVLIFKKDPDIKLMEKLFKELHSHYKMSHYITIIKSNPYCQTLKDYVDLCNMNYRSKDIYVVSNQDLERFNRIKTIKHILDDIELKGDLNDPRVKVYCQPILDVDTKTFTTAESLMRLETPETGLIYPDSFIPIAEASGKIHWLTKIILNKVCDFIEHNPRIQRISVNFSMSELAIPFFYEDIMEIITKYSFDKSKLGFEITESVEAGNFDLTHDILTKFKELGIAIYLDDFGTGFSNIEHITKLPIDIIKFDRSLVLSSKADKKSENIVASLSDMFNIIGYNILYEGIEDGHDENRCIQLKAHYLQGFMYSKPIPIEQLSDFVDREYPDEISF